MALDKETARSLLVKICSEINPHSVTPLNPDGSYFVVTPEEFDATAQAIYELGWCDGSLCEINAETNYIRGVQDERERAAKVCSDHANGNRDNSDKSLYAEVRSQECDSLAEAIRKG